MADTKISALTSASTPLAGTEVLPIVQSSTTVKVATNDLTVRNIRANATTGILQVTGPTDSTTRVMTTPDANFTAARTDAAQTFSGVQTFSGSAVIGGDSNSTAGVTAQGTNANNGIMQLGSTGKLYQFRGGDYQGVMELYTASGAGDIVFTVSNTTRGRINSSGFKPIAGNGIDFSANTPLAGMTSQLLNWYEQGTWTPTVASGSGTLTSYTVNAIYTRIGRQVTVTVNINITNAGTGSGVLTISLPHTPLAYSFSGSGRENTLGNILQAYTNGGSTIYVFSATNTTIIATGATPNVQLTYFV